MKTIKFYTLGCKVNQYDTQNIRERFLRAGFRELENGQPADIYVINTCTVTQRADSESLAFIRRAKKENPKAKLIVTGCLAELDENKIKDIDKKAIIVKNKGVLDSLAIRKLGLVRSNNNALPYSSSEVFVSSVPSREASSEAFAFGSGRVEKNSFSPGISYFKGHTRAFLKVQDGCDNSCSYCKVPLVRGRSRSRPLKEVIAEARALAKNNFKEIVLTGICLGAYGKDLTPKISLVDVINRLECIEGLLRIRLSSIELGDISDELINKISSSGKLCRHLHIPLQSGDNEILKRMNRKYACQDYLEIVKKIKRKIPQVAITTDVLVGFPGENDSNFKNTVELLKKIQPLKAHIFPYSKRPGTQAADYSDAPISQDLLKKRIQALKQVAEASSIAYKRRFLGRKLAVLIESRSKEDPSFWEGFSDNYIRVRVSSEENLKNQLILLKSKEIVKNYVLADLS